MTRDSNNDAKKWNVWLVGRCDPAEFCAAIKVLQQHAQVIAFPTASEAINPASPESVAGSAHPDFIVLLQRYAGEFDRRTIATVSRQHPLAPVVCVMGTYCEGETRSGQPLENTFRLFWYNASARLEDGFLAAERGRCPWWSQPTTLTDEERWLIRSPLPNIIWPGKVAVFAATPDFAAPTIELLNRCGAETAYLAPAAGSVIPTSAGQDRAQYGCAFWDGAAAGRYAPTPLPIAVQIANPAPLIAMMTFPRTQDVKRATACGSVLTVPKLIAADELIWHAARLLQLDGQLRLHDAA
jgi:hypothetical protein